MGTLQTAKYLVSMEKQSGGYQKGHVAKLIGTAPAKVHGGPENNTDSGYVHTCPVQTWILGICKNLEFGKHSGSILLRLSKTASLLQLSVADQIATMNPFLTCLMASTMVTVLPVPGGPNIR